MIKQYQVTLMSNENKYRPVSAIVSMEAIDLTNKTQRQFLVKRGTEKICAQRYWGKADLLKYGYLKAKIREYDKEKIEKENKERYEKIKEAHYQDGSWKRPKEK